MPVAIIDPNNDDITLWETEAIISYLVITYDQSKSLTFTSFPEKFLLQQWSYFQASSQSSLIDVIDWYVRPIQLLHPITILFLTNHNLY